MNAAGDRNLRWRDLLGRWSLIENDLQDRGIDLDDPQIRGRSARWLRVRILGLLSADTRLSRALAPKTRSEVAS